MEQDISQVVRAITVASDPSQVVLHQEALTFLSSVQQNAQTNWRVGLTLFLDINPDGTRKYTNDARFYALRIVDEFLEGRYQPFDNETFQFLQQALVNYIQAEYVYGSAESAAPFLRNKFAHTLGLFFLCTYNEQWPTFFADLVNFIQPQNPGESYNPHLSMLFFHVILEISGEVADQLLKSARTFTKDRGARDAKVRDLVRERDAGRINDAVLMIVSQGRDRLNNEIRKGNTSPELEREASRTVEVVELGVKTYASYVGWIDINLTVTPSTVPLLFGLLADPALTIRLATCIALLRIVVKGLKEPGDKLQLLKVLSLNDVLDTLEAETRQQQQARQGDDDDEDEESYREALGKLLNVLGLQWTSLSEDSAATDDIRAEASVYQLSLLPIMLRFMADEWDDTCNTVFPFLHVVLTNLKRLRKTLGPVPLDNTKRNFVASVLQVVLSKMKWREDSDTNDPEDEDFQEFEAMRKELRIFLDHLLFLDTETVVNTVRALTLNTLSSFQSGASVPWNDAELAVYLVYIYGEVNKSLESPKGRGAFCQAPSVDKEQRKTTDYASYPLTAHGEMMMALVQSGIVAYPHTTVSLLAFEATARYSDFFKVRKECIMPTLESFLDNRGLHRPEGSHYQNRLFYLFHRFMRDCRNDISPDICGTIVDSLRDLLPIRITPAPAKEHDSNATIQDPLIQLTHHDKVFEAQMYLYEAVGNACSLVYKTPEQQSALLLSTYTPLMTELEESLRMYPKNPGDILVIAKIHHVIMALGSVAKGFPDLPSPLPEGYILPPIAAFTQVAQAILVCLEHMKTQKVVRDATRFTFARILAVAGSNVTHVVPVLMTNLLSHFEPSELVDFIRFISLLVHKLKNDVFNVLDELIGPLSSHILQILSQPVSGTDDQTAHTETKRTYLAFLNNIMTAKLEGAFLTERNKANLESLLDSLQQLGQDTSDTQASRSAFLFLERAILAWGRKTQDGVQANDIQPQELPGFERVIYERIVPAAFSVPNSPQINLKDGGILTVLHQIANIFHSVYKARGSEALEFFHTIFLPSQNWPPEAAAQFTNNLRDLDAQGFRKYFADFVRSSRSS